jgi:hypothetical protein
MKIRWALLRYLWMKVAWVTALAGAAWLAAVMLPRALHELTDEWPVLLVMAHAGVVAWLMGRYHTGEFAFLQSRGFSRGTLWGHTMAVSGLSALAAVGVGAVMVWSGVRSGFQDVVMQNALFPVAAFRERHVPWMWMGLYAVMMPAGQYVWMRLAEGTQGRRGGLWLALGVIMALVAVYGMSTRYGGWRAGVLIAGACVVAGVFVVCSRGAYRELEVRA